MVYSFSHGRNGAHGGAPSRYGERRRYLMNNAFRTVTVFVPAV